MRTALLSVLLLAGCSVPLKFHPFQLPDGHEDVLWVTRGATLYRCSQPEKSPPTCVAAQWHGPARGD